MLDHVGRQAKLELIEWFKKNDELKRDFIDPLVSYLQRLILPYIAVFAFLQLATLVTVIILILKPANT